MTDSSTSSCLGDWSPPTPVSGGVSPSRAQRTWLSLQPVGDTPQASVALHMLFPPWNGGRGSLPTLPLPLGLTCPNTSLVPAAGAHYRPGAPLHVCED